MKHCDKCQALIPTWDVQSGKRVNTQRRRFCFECSPYKAHNTRDLTTNPVPEGHKSGYQGYDPERSGPAAVKKWRKNLKRRMITAMGSQCQCCGYDKCDNALEFHHLDPTQKETTFGGARSHPRAWKVLIVELRKCVLVCCLCHREIHAGAREVPAEAKRFDERWVDYKAMEKELVRTERLKLPTPKM